MALENSAPQKLLIPFKDMTMFKTNAPPPRGHLNSATRGQLVGQMAYVRVQDFTGAARDKAAQMGVFLTECIQFKIPKRHEHVSSRSGNDGALHHCCPPS
jgi:hypothetical protein